MTSAPALTVASNGTPRAFSQIELIEPDSAQAQRSGFYGAVANEAPKNSQAFVNFVGSAIDQFHLEVPQNDDITISTVKRLK